MKSALLSIAAGLALFIIVTITAYRMTYIQLPDTFEEKDKMQIVDFILRLFYFYPVKSLGLLGYIYQLHWTRGILTVGSWLLGPKTLNDPDLNITDLHWQGVPVRVYEPRGKRASDGATVFIHGGGFVVLSVAAYDDITRTIAKESNAVVVSIDYRLAPEYMFPAGLDDCEAVVRHFLRTAHKDYNVDPSKVVIMGDSAGGNLAAVVTKRLRDNPEPGTPALKGQVLIYPVLQFLDMKSPSYQQFDRKLTGTSFVDAEALVRWLLLYLSIEPDEEHVQAVLANNHTSPAIKADPRFRHLRHHNLPESFMTNYTTPPDYYGNSKITAALEPYLLHPDFCPLCVDDVSGLPSALIMTAEYDILRDDGAWYAKRLKESGVDVEWKHYETAFHAFINFHTELELGRDAIRYMSKWALAKMEE